jgi:hypothetical protein
MVGYPDLLLKVGDLVECIIDLFPDPLHRIRPNDPLLDASLNFEDQIRLARLITFFFFHYNNYNRLTI